MSYIAREARQELLETVAAAAEEIGASLALVEAAYELLDEGSADRLEEQLFRPVQRAYGRAQRTHAGFAERHGLDARPFDCRGSRATRRRSRASSSRTPSTRSAEADERLAELQDSMRPVEVGDPELRAGLAEVARELSASCRSAREAFLRTLGR